MGKALNQRLRGLNGAETVVSKKSPDLHQMGVSENRGIIRILVFRVLY